MPTHDSSTTVSFKSPEDLSNWLKVNHASTDELWVKVFKKGSGIQSVTWNEIVIEALCWGWIDGVKKSLDTEAYLQRITPRKARSNWSKRNTEHVERLITEGRMQEAGLVHVGAAKADGRWENAYAAKDLEVPQDFLAAIAARPKAKEFFDQLSKSNRYVIAYALTAAKRPETRERRFQKYLHLIEQGEKPV